MNVDTLNQAAIRELAAVDQGPCVTIVMPTHPTGAEGRQDPIRLRNLVDAAERKLIDADLPKGRVDQLLAEVRELASHGSFWQQKGRGLAIFIAGETTRILRLPRPADPAVHVGPRFVLKPLFSSAPSSLAYYAVLLTKKRARLVRGSEDEFEEIHNDLFPVSLEEISGVREPEEDVQRENTLNPSPAIGQRGGATFHGHGVVEGHRMADLQHFASDVAKRADATIGADGATVLVVADARLAAMVEERYPRHGSAIVLRVLPTSPDGLSDSDLRNRCWALASEAAKEDVSRILNRFGTAASESRAVEGVENLALPAALGRVDTLIFDARYERIGCIADDLSEVQLAGSSETGNGSIAQGEDLMNRSVIDTVLNSGRIVSLEPAAHTAPMPPKAILRY